MLISSIKHTVIVRCLHPGVLAATNNGPILQSIGQKRNFAKVNKGSCCKEIAQTEGKRVEPWPKSDSPPPAWRAECPQDPQPPNYDPYRIKVPEPVVPPLPQNNVKEVLNEDGELFRSPEIGSLGVSMQNMFHTTPLVHPDYWKDKPEKRKLPEVLPKLGYHGRNKYKYAFHEPWKPLDRITLLQEAESTELQDASATNVDDSKTVLSKL